jgi:hypothetical protein
VEAELVGELDLVEGVVESLFLRVLIPRPRKLMFVEKPEAHVASIQLGIAAQT